MDLPVAVQLLLVYLLVFAINVAPAFMPATWAVLAFFHVVYQLPLLPLSLGGAVSATLGRVVLARLSATLRDHLLSPQQRENLMALGEFLEERRGLTLASVLLFAFGPIPSNQLFIAAGLTGTDLRLIVPPFLVGRLVSNTILIYLTGQATARLGELFGQAWRHPGALVVQIGGLLLLAALTVIDWTSVLQRWVGWRPPWKAAPGRAEDR